MILSVEELQKLPEFEYKDTSELQCRLEALETLVRKYTNNKFQNRHIRFTASCVEHKINGGHPFIRVGDTIEISASEANDGLYVVTNIEDGNIIVDANLFPVEQNLVTKIEYPADVKAGVLNLMKWELQNRSKVGIKSETLSRHSVTYYDQDSNNQIMGYPVSLMGFLKPYKKVRC